MAVINIPKFPSPKIAYKDTKQFQNNDYFMLYRKMDAYDVGGNARPKLSFTGYQATMALQICFDSNEHGFILTGQKYFGGVQAYLYNLVKSCFSTISKGGALV